jgi:NADH:ubiquinone oxidoreductase subunit 6 (subunit J)
MMPVTLDKIVFAVLALWVIGSAILVVTVRNIFHSLLFLVMTFLGVAGVYLLLSADFLAAVQVLVYIGAIVTLIMFALMLTHRVMSRSLVQTLSQWWLALPISVGVLGILIRIFVMHPWAYPIEPQGPTTGIIGQALLTKYLLPFELASIVLLVSMVGAIILAKEDKADDSA